MSFLLRPMIWYKFIGGMVALKGKYCFSSFPQPCLQMHITAFPNGAGHLSALWRTKRVARMWGCYIQLQQEAALRQTDMFRGKCLNFDASVGCQTILPTLVHDRADASGGRNFRKMGIWAIEIMIEHALGKSLHCIHR